MKDNIEFFERVNELLKVNETIYEYIVEYNTETNTFEIYSYNAYYRLSRNLVERINEFAGFDKNIHYYLTTKEDKAGDYLPCIVLWFGNFIPPARS